MEKWLTIQQIEQYPEVDEQRQKEAMAQCVAQVKHNLPAFETHFPAANSENNFYTPGINTDWTSGFWTGEVWLAYENARNEEDRRLFKEAGDKQVHSFLERINIKHYVDHHDLGFLYTPSCVSAYKLTGSGEAREAAIKAADQLMTRYRPKGKYIQAWGEMDTPDQSPGPQEAAEGMELRDAVIYDAIYGQQYITAAMNQPSGHG